MLFYTLAQLNSRNDTSGMYVELQFCNLPLGTGLENIVDPGNISNRSRTSLYVLDEDLFFNEYKDVFDCGIRNNLRCGTVDLCGINYYEPCRFPYLLKKINAQKPLDFLILLSWLEKAEKKHNGFYILGL